MINSILFVEGLWLVGDRIADVKAFDKEGETWSK